MNDQTKANNQVEANDVELDEESLDGGVVETNEASVDVQDVAEVGDAEPTKPSLVAMLAGNQTVNVTVSPRILLTVNANDIDLPNVVRAGDAYYSLASPMRKSKSQGTKKDPYGLVRNGLTELVKYVAGLAGREVVFFGKVEDLEGNVNTMLDQLTNSAETIMWDAFAGEEFITYPAPVVEAEEVEADTDEEEELEEDELDAVAINVNAGPEMLRTHVSELFAIESWTVIGQSEDGVTIVRPTININVNCPVLNTGDIVKTLNTTANILRNFAKKVELPSSDIGMALAFGAEDLNDPEILRLLGSFEGDVTPTVIGSEYMQQAIQDPTTDAFDLVPVGSSLTEAHDTLFTNGGEMLLMFPS